MIIPMTKFAFLVYHLDYPVFMEELQKIGLIHVSGRGQHIGEKEKKFLDQINRLKTTISILEKREPFGSFSIVSTDQFLDRIDDIIKEKDQLDNQLKKVEKELNDLLPWGNISVADLKRISELGLTIKFFQVPEKRYSEVWIAAYATEEISRVNGNVYFVALAEHGVDISLEATEVKAPAFSYSDKQAEFNSIEATINQINAELNAMASQLDFLAIEKARIENELEIEKVWSDTLKEADEKVMILEGWAPAEKNSEIVSFAERNGVYFISEEGKVENNPPILLKNNWFARLFEPIGELFSLPIYNEIDLTAFFAPFFMMFFGFCLADAGYGVVLILLATFFKFKVKANMKPLLSLIQWLGLATVIFGIITGTLFGVVLVNVDLGSLNRFKSLVLGSQDLFYLAMMVGLFQILFGMVIKAFNLAKQNTWLHAVSTFGWFFLIVFTIVCVLLGDKYPAFKTMGTVHLIGSGICGIAIFFFNSPGKNPFINVGLGLWDTYNMLTGLLGDVLSYIRLFALALSGAILGSVYNSLAFGMAPDIPVVKQIVILLILVIGHSINLFMAGLGALVHPMRLIFVEFYKNANFTGGGIAYQPFKKQIIK